jgi:hypothetical protein
MTVSVKFDYPSSLAKNVEVCRIHLTFLLEVPMFSVDSLKQKSKTSNSQRKAQD